MDSKKLFIVIIDGSPTVCKILEVALSREGYQVLTFQDPVLALRSLLVTGEVPVPDVLLVDLFLPRISGLQVIMRLRNHSRGKLIPIVVISRFNGLVDRLKARLAGASAYLVKPLKIKEVIALVEGYAKAK